MRTMAFRLCTAFVVLLLSIPASAQDQWPRFRGPNGTGISELQGLPTSWSKSDYDWIIQLDGKGHSSPCVWGEHLFLTTGTDAGARTLLCLNALTGKTIWSHTIQLAPSHLHKKNSYASGTPTTDGQRVFAAFGDDQHVMIVAYDMQGKQLWSRDLGTFESQHGYGISPIIYEDKLIVPNDQIGPSSYAALDVATGETVWRSEREHNRTSYSTPFILDVDGQKQIITLSDATGVGALDPADGHKLWASGTLPLRTVASPINANGLIIASCGSGGRGKYMAGVDPTPGSAGERVAEERKQNLPYVPTPVVYGKYLFLWNDDGIVCCVDPTKSLSENIWRERVGGNYSGSPVIVDGKIYCISEEGDVVVLDAAPDFKKYGASPLGDQSYATPAVANGRMYLRGFSTLACLKAKGAVAAIKE